MQEAWFGEDQDIFSFPECSLPLLDIGQTAAGSLYPRAATDAAIPSFTPRSPQAQRKSLRGSSPLRVQSRSPKARQQRRSSSDFQEHLDNASRRNSLSVSPHSPGSLAPVSVFQDQQSQDLDKLAQIRITICPQGLSKMESGDTNRKSGELSTTPSDNLDTCHVGPRQSMTMAGSNSGAMSQDYGEDADTGEGRTIQRPLIQTGMLQPTRSSDKPTSPTSGGGKRVLRTAEERKAHRMAKNRATAAASRRRKQAAKEEMMNRQEQLEQEHARLLELLQDREEEIAGLRERLAVADIMAPRLDLDLDASQGLFPVTTAAS